MTHHLVGSDGSAPARTPAMPGLLGHAERDALADAGARS
jgi:hypothetical protein